MSIAKKLFALAAPVALLALSACTTGLPTQVQRFQAMPAPQGQAFVIVPTNEANRGGLEFSQYADLVRRHLVAQGFAEAPTPEQATLIVSLDYGIDSGRERIVSYPDPFPYYGYGGFGRYGGYGRGWGRGTRASRSRRSWTAPTASAIRLSTGAGAAGAATTPTATPSTPPTSIWTSSGRPTASRCSKDSRRRIPAPTNCRPWSRTWSRRCSPASPEIRARRCASRCRRPTHARTTDCEEDEEGAGNPAPFRVSFRAVS